MISTQREQNDVECPKCGTLNKGLYLHETEGRYVCDSCGHEGQLPQFKRPIRIPLLTQQQLVAMSRR